MDVNVLPKGHIIGWAPQPTAESASKPMSKSAKKNAKRRDKKTEKKEVPEDWEEEEDESIPSTVKGVQTNGGVSSTKEPVEADRTQETLSWAAAPDPECKATTAISTEDTLAAEVQKMGLS